ncbi:MAG: hypothetical protein JW941_12455 [Candidatus Coatesbacteria bacterium]|nr:hypothetical protein [Candidatus Coatesbacteria bacterium]
MKKQVLIIAVFILATAIMVAPGLSKKAKDDSPESVRFWISSDGDVLVEEIQRVGGAFSKVKRESSGTLLRLRWPATAIWHNLPDEPILGNRHGSAHFIGGERLFAITSQVSGDDDYRVLFWDGIRGIWRLLAPMATLDPVRGVFRTTLGPKRWVSIASPDDGVRVCGFILDDYLSDVERKLCFDPPNPLSPRTVVQSEDGNTVGIVMVPLKPNISQKSRMTKEEVQRRQGKVEVAMFDVSGTEPTVRVGRVESLKVGDTEPDTIVAAGNCFISAYYENEKVRMIGFEVTNKGTIEKMSFNISLDRLAPDSMVELSPSIKGDGVVLIDSDGDKAAINKLSPKLASLKKWTLKIPKDAEGPIRQLLFNDSMGFLYLCDSKGKIIVRTEGGSTDVLWPQEKKAEKR